jgi:UDP-galactose transporter B1
MFSNNLVQLLANLAFYTFSYLVHGDDTLMRVVDRTLAWDVLMISLSGALGQIFIYFAISLFDCYLLTIITTSRKLISVVLSNFWFGHHFHTRQWIGSSIVMVCLFVEMSLSKSKSEGQNAKKDQ